MGVTVDFRRETMSSPPLPPGLLVVPTLHQEVKSYYLQRLRADGTVQYGGIIGAEVTLHGDCWVADGAVVASGTLTDVQVPAGVVIENSMVESVELSGFRGTILDSVVVGTGPASVLAGVGGVRLENSLVEFGADILLVPPGEWSGAHLGSRHDLAFAAAGDAQVAAVRVDGGVEVEIVNLGYDGVRNHRTTVSTHGQLQELMATLPERFHAPAGDPARAAARLLEVAVGEMLR
jgi:hypothetical protein